MREERKRLNLPVIPRKKEEALLQRALQKAKDGSVQVVFLSGAPGVGKSTIAAKVLLNEKGCWCAQTKFDQRRSRSPLAPLRQLLSDLIASSIKESSCYAAIRKELTTVQLKVLARFVRPAQRLLDEEEIQEAEEFPLSLTNAAAYEVSRHRINVFISALRACFRAITTIAPVILVLDDAMWSCAVTREVVHAILVDPFLKRVFVCATFRTQDDPATSSKSNRALDFVSFREKLERDLSEDRTQTILLKNLGLDQVEELLSEATILEKSRLQDLAEAVHTFTNGNIFFLRQFVGHLQDENLLMFDTKNNRWTWNVEEINQGSSVSDNVVKTLASRIHKLPQSVQHVLTLASCFGSQFDVRALNATKAALDIASVYESLEIAREQEFILQLNDTLYKFSHDIVELVAYELLPESLEIRQLHWSIGLLLKESCLLKEDDSILFATVDHLNLGKEFLVGDEIKFRVAELNYTAATKAAALSAFSPAKTYLKEGIDILGKSPFDKYYDMALKMYELYTKAEYCSGTIAKAREAAQQVIDHAHTRIEKDAAYLALINCYGAENQISDLVAFLMHLLHTLGVKIPEDPRRMQTALKFQKWKHRLNSISDEEILDLPMMTDTKQEFILKVLLQLVFPLYELERVKLGTYVMCEMVRITLKYGLNKYSPEVFSFAGSYLIVNTHDVKQGSRFGNIATKLLDKVGVDATNAHVYRFIANNIKWWVEPVPNSLDMILLGYAAAMRSGDIGSAFRASSAYAINYFYSGLALPALLTDLEQYCAQYLEYNQPFFYLGSTPLLQCLLVLSGECKNMEEGYIIEHRNQMGNATTVLETIQLLSGECETLAPGGTVEPQKVNGEQSIWSFSMQVAFYMGDLEKATKMVEKLSHISAGMMRSCFFYSCRDFFFALIAIANYRKDHKRGCMVEAKRHIRNFHKYVRGGGINLVHKLQILEAEMMSLECNSRNCMAVLRKYEDAIAFATRTGFPQDAALANYLCYQFLKHNRVKKHMDEKVFLKRSFELWIQWGAVAVAASVAQRHPDVFNSGSVRKSLECSKTSNNQTYRSRSRFDGRDADQHKTLHVPL